jgi:Fe-S-cluster containining protein
LEFVAQMSGWAGKDRKVLHCSDKTAGRERQPPAHAEELRNMQSGYDCQTCGACCISDPGARAGYVGLDTDDQHRMLQLGLPLVKSGGRMELGTVPYDGPGGERVCVAFAGTVGESCRCTIREDQPKACRSFVVGGLLCRLARHQAGLGPEPEEWRSRTRALAAV